MTVFVLVTLACLYGVAFTHGRSFQRAADIAATPAALPDPDVYDQCADAFDKITREY